MKPFPGLHNKTIYLVRHGLATLSKDGYGDSILIAPLLLQGRGAIERIAEYLKQVPDSYNVSSMIPRCRETAEIITRVTGKQFIFDKRIREYHQETFASLQQRIVSFLTDLSDVEQKDTIICSHSSVITGIKEYVLTGSFSPLEEYDNPREGTLAVIQNGFYTEHDFNIPTTSSSVTWGKES